MKLDEVEKRVAKIESLVGQMDGVAHGLEDALFLDVLKAIAAGAQNPRKLAETALKSSELEIERWFE